MAKIKSNTKLDLDHPIYIGIDVHKKTWSIAVVHRGEVISQIAMPSDFNKLRKTLQRYEKHKIKSCYEAGFSGYWLHDSLVGIGVQNSVIVPNKIPLSFGDKVKTDKRDAAKLALLLSQGLLRFVHVPTKQQRSFRQLLRTREQLMVRKRACFQQLKGLLIQMNIVFDESSLTKSLVDFLESLPLPEQERHVVELHVKNYKEITSQTRALERLALKTVKEDSSKTFSCILSAPGVGNITGLALLHEIGDWSRFTNYKQICSYLGLTPREYSSGDKICKGRITGQGNAWLRALLIEAAWRAINQDPVLKDFYDRIAKQTRSKKKAVVAVAKKLIARIYAIVKKQELYSIGVN